MQSITAAEHRALFERTNVDQHVPTDEAATLLGVAPQTLRRWACEGSGPLRPRKLNGRLRWSVAQIRAVLAGATVQASAA
jgi:predicted site-specific integrase-resolvase